MSKVFEALENARVPLATPTAATAAVTPPLAARSTPWTAVPAAFSRVNLEEEMLRLHQSVAALLPDRPSRVIQFIAARPGEGTSTIAREFARVAATRLGRRVLLLEGAPGPLGSAHREITMRVEPRQVGNASLFVAKAWSAEPVESPGSESAHSQDALRQSYPLVVIDSPPPGSSHALTFEHVDGVVLVMEADGTRWPVVERLKRDIERAGSRVLGVAFNRRRYHIPTGIYKFI